MFNKDIFDIIKDEISEMQDWIPFSSALGACGIHASRATNDQVEQVAETVKSDPRLITAFYVMGESMDFEKDSTQFNKKIAEVLETEDLTPLMEKLSRSIKTGPTTYKRRITFETIPHIPRTGHPCPWRYTYTSPFR